MKITAASMFIIAALAVASANSVAAPAQASVAASMQVDIPTMHTGSDLQSANQSGCAKWREFTAGFGLTPSHANLDQRSDVGMPDC
ncbi:MAG: hypothetical protein ABJN35_07840 [Erythrobacter sp.]